MSEKFSENDLKMFINLGLKSTGLTFKICNAEMLPHKSGMKTPDKTFQLGYYSTPMQTHVLDNRNHNDTFYIAVIRVN
jgi:hypothetical protein